MKICGALDVVLGIHVDIRAHIPLKMPKRRCSFLIASYALSRPTETERKEATKQASKKARKKKEIKKRRKHRTKKRRKETQKGRQREKNRKAKEERKTDRQKERKRRKKTEKPRKKWAREREGEKGSCLRLLLPQRDLRSSEAR